MKLLDEIRLPGRSFHEAIPSPSIMATGVVAMPLAARLVRETEDQAIRHMTQWVDEAVLVTGVEWERIARAFTSLADTVSEFADTVSEFGPAYEEAEQLNPRDATSVLAARSARAAARQAGLDRAGSRSAWVSGPGLRRPPNARSTRPAARRSR